ncbi:uncharacterized protein ACNLHF_021651 isoform 2-T2 [Anomaloglossus baeobatrachus]
MRAEGTAFVYSVERCTCLTIRSACSSGIHGPQRAPAAGHAYGPFKELCFSHPHKEERECTAQHGILLKNSQYTNFKSYKDM